MVSILSTFPNDMILSILTLFFFFPKKISWEYPTKAGIGCNIMNKNDSANFLSFLQELRRDPLGYKLILSASTAVLPFVGPDGNPLSDVSGFAKVLDYIEIMNYDVWGSWNPIVGPNAPLNDTCATPNQSGSAVSAVQKWHAAGIPLRQIVLGVAAYGHSFKVDKTDAFEPGSTSLIAPYPKFNSAAHPKGDSWDGDAGVDVCGNAVSPGGVINFWGLIKLGYLNPNGTPKQGVFFRYDNCSQTVSFPTPIPCC
jgi:chitinase